MTSHKPYPGTQAVIRALTILKSFSAAKPEWGLSELATFNDLNKTTTFRLLSALDSEGMVERNPNSGLYRLGPGAIALGSLALRGNDLWTAGHGELGALASNTGETATLELMRGGEILILDEELGGHMVGTMPTIGTRWPIHATSTGKLYLAAMTSEEQAAILSFPLPQLTENTITTREAMDEEINLIRHRGYAIAVDELEIGYTGLGVSVYDHLGKLAGTVSVGGPTSRINSECLPEIVSSLFAAARRISHRLGYISTDLE